MKEEPCFLFAGRRRRASWEMYARVGAQLFKLSTHQSSLKTEALKIEPNFSTIVYL